jgi:hypothetical protein
LKIFHKEVNILYDFSLKIKPKTREIFPLGEIYNDFGSTSNQIFKPSQFEKTFHFTPSINEFKSMINHFIKKTE